MTKEINKKILVRDRAGARKSGLSFTILKIICAIITLLAVTSYLQVFFLPDVTSPKRMESVLKNFLSKKMTFMKKDIPQFKFVSII